MAEHTLIDDLVDVVDDARRQHKALGTRPYTWTVVVVQWSGGARGRGTASVVSTNVLDPVPAYEDLDLDFTLQEVGRNENGWVRLKEISLRYNEEDLLPHVPVDQEVFYEMALTPPGKQARVRRFIPDGVPEYEASSVGWTIKLRQQGAARNRAGLVQ